MSSGGVSPGMALALVAGAYLLGSVSFSVVLVKLAQGLDVRTVGSGNAGATNVMRAAGKKVESRVPGPSVHPAQERFAC